MRILTTWGHDSLSVSLKVNSGSLNIIFMVVVVIIVVAMVMMVVVVVV